MITITLEGNTWKEIMQEMSIAQEAIKRARIEDNPGKGIVAPDERSGQDGPEKPVCAYCGVELGQAAVNSSTGELFCSVGCRARYDYMEQAGDIVADACQKCQADRHNKLMGILESGYGLGPEEVAEILERVR